MNLIRSLFRDPSTEAPLCLPVSPFTVASCSWTCPTPPQCLFLLHTMSKLLRLPSFLHMLPVRVHSHIVYTCINSVISQLFAWRTNSPLAASPTKLYYGPSSAHIHCYPCSRYRSELIGPYGYVHVTVSLFISNNVRLLKLW